MTAKPAGEPRPTRWTLKLHDSYSEKAWMILRDGDECHVCGPKAGEEMVALAAAETRAAQPPDALRERADKFISEFTGSNGDICICPACKPALMDGLIALQLISGGRDAT